MSKHEIAAELHGAVRRTYPRRRVIVYGKNDLYQGDLVDMRQYSDVNKNYNYILTTIDCYTKYAYGIALRTKRGDEVSKAAIHIVAFLHRIDLTYYTSIGGASFTIKILRL